MNGNNNYYAIWVSCFVFIGAGRCLPALASDNKRAPLADRVDVTLTVSGNEIVTFQPVLARVTLLNRGVEPFELDVRADGAPYALTCLIAYEHKEPFDHSQWIRRSGPGKRSITLAAGEETTGEILIWLGPPTGFAFSEPGIYAVQFAFQPASHHPQYAPVLTNTVELTVVPDKRDNRRFLKELNELAYEHFGYDREILLRNTSEQYLVAIDLVQTILQVQEPHLIDPESDAYNREQARLVETLTNMLERYPDTSYSGYIARYLGLVHIKTFEHVMSHGHVQGWTRRDLTPEQKAARERAAVAREKALRYLTMASQHDLWLRTTALEQLGFLYAMSEQWDKVQECVARLRAMEEASNEPEVAARIEAEAKRYREKLERRSAQSETPHP